MGVMTCFRTNCTNIMCETYINDIGYICTDCQDEFMRKKENYKSEKALLKSLSKFMEKRKRYKYSPEENVNVGDFFRGHTNY